MDTPIELLTQAFIRRVAGGEETLFRGMVTRSEEHRLLWEGFVSKGYFENTLSDCMLWMQKGLFVSFMN